MTEMIPTLINGRWTILLPEHRAHRAEWVTGWERERLDSMRSVLEPGMTVVDVGAEEGDLPGLWASWGCRVALIEPQPATWPNMRAVWEANDLPDPAGMFVGFASDVTELDVKVTGYGAVGYPPPGRWPACAFGEVIGDHGWAHLAQQADSIPQTTLDDFAVHEGIEVDAITIDVEGAEYRVLRGAEGILRERRPVVWCSIHSDRAWVEDLYEAADLDVIVGWMDEVGYDYTYLAEDHELHAMFTPR